MNPELTEEEIRQCAEMLHARYGESVEFYIEWIKEDPWAASRKHVAERLDKVQTVRRPLPAAA